IDDRFIVDIGLDANRVHAPLRPFVDDSIAPHEPTRARINRVSAESISKNFQLIEDTIYARASGFVRRYRIVDERPERGVYAVRIKADVDDKAVVDDLTLIMKTRPRVIIMIAEQNVGREGFSYWWGAKGLVSDMRFLSNALVREWRPKGFKFVDPALLADDLKVKGALRKPALSNASAVSVARNTDADVVIVGKVLVTDGGPVMQGVDMRSFNAVATLRALNVDTAEIIAVANQSATAAHIDPNVGGRAAVQNLAPRVSADLEKQIVSQWTSQAAGARELELVVKGASAKVARSIERTIRERIRGVESVRLRRRRARRAWYDVRVRASADNFGEDLQEKALSRFGLELKSVRRNRLVADVVKP
ncbi:MAG: hypothetical protein AAFV29_06000, partial [Myxococcota bacterium]